MEREQYATLVADKRSYSQLFCTFESEETDRGKIGEEVVGLIKDAKSEMKSKNGDERGWGMAAFNNFHINFSVQHQEMLKEGGIYEKRARFWEDVNTAAEESGFDPEEEIFKPLSRKEITMDEVYENEGLIAAYVRLRALGHKHRDLTR